MFCGPISSSCPRSDRITVKPFETLTREIWLIHRPGSLYCLSSQVRRYLLQQKGRPCVDVVHSGSSTNTCSAGLLVLSSVGAVASVKTAIPQTSQYPGANALHHWTEVMNPHAKLERQKLLDQAERRRKSRHLLQVTHLTKLPDRCIQVAYCLLGGLQAIIAQGHLARWLFRLHSR